MAESREHLTSLRCKSGKYQKHRDNPILMLLRVIPQAFYNIGVVLGFSRGTVTMKDLRERALERSFEAPSYVVQGVQISSRPYSR